MKRPAFQFYPGDWQHDSGLRLCSVSARGLWIEMMCLMHQAEPYGYLVLNGSSIAAAQLGRLVGGAEKGVKRWLAELEAAGVYGKDVEGRIFSRRMVRDEDLRNRRAEGGKAGAEHGYKGAEAGSKGGRPSADKGGLSTPSKPAPSSSAFSSSSSSEDLKSVVGLTPDAVLPEGKNGHDRGQARQLRIQAEEVLAFLNEKAGKSYQPVAQNIDLIVSLLRQGATREDLRAVVAKKCREWKGNPDVDKYLRPATLFGPKNFWAKYQGELMNVGSQQ